ncbi:cadmium-translocating P-type ATPase [Ramlibacter sp. XY19]|uniref:heavy metal translocating P-type ATPase n=1 Tax=Ramlibacter paludis TaxID=2908000 RepID=UPI0023DC926E|nr:cation-translocating P-type ATPase [Ramlibacter paludis]MCG2595515.1 cadmium-translocating P-type ATPase [Ramlibacter paludis]
MQAALDARTEWESFSRPLADGRREAFLAIQGMYCAACTLAIEQALKPLPGVHEVAVNGATEIARVVWSPQQGQPSQWLAALHEAGYGGLPAGDQLAALPRLQAQRRLLWRWLVAGFCMMQVMMYAVPAYVAQPGEMTPDAAALLRWASWLLTLPVLLFSCSPFFSCAWRDLTARRIGMDVPVALGILIAFGASTAATFDPQGPLAGEVWYDSLTMFVFFLLSGRLLEQRLRDRTAGSLEALLRRLPESVERLREDGSGERVPARSLVVGDRIRVRAGEAFPADGCVLEGASQVDEALLTGEARPLRRTVGDAVVAGSHNLSGTLVLRVERTGADTRFAQIVALMERASTAKPRLAQLADRIASPFLCAVLLAAGAAAWWWWPQGPGHALGIAVAVLIVTCPCALALATPAATLAAAGALARRGILVRRLEALEAAAALDTVLFDKTGTLTADRLSVVAVRTRPGVSEAQALEWAGALAKHSLHPVSRAVAGGELAASEVVEHPGRGVEGVVQGIGRMWWGRFANPPCEGSASLADDQGWIASFFLDETLRPGAAEAVAGLQGQGLRTEILSGDSAAAVQLLADRVGIRLAHGGQSPQDKLDRLAALQDAGRRVAMVGDGLNDGPVLARADVAIAVGDAVPLAQARCDFIVPGGQPAALPLLLRQARRTRSVVRQNLAWAAAYNAVCVPLALAGQMPPWLAGLGMAASSLFVVLNAARLARLPKEG